MKRAMTSRKWILSGSMSRRRSDSTRTPSKERVTNLRIAEITEFSPLSLSFFFYCYRSIHFTTIDNRYSHCKSTFVCKICNEIQPMTMQSPQGFGAKLNGTASSNRLCINIHINIDLILEITGKIVYIFDEDRFYTFRPIKRLYMNDGFERLAIQDL